MTEDEDIINKKKEIEGQTDYHINKIKKICDINFDLTFAKYKQISPKLSFFEDLDSKAGKNIQLKESILYNCSFELAQAEETSVLLMYIGYYNTAVANLRNCLDIFLTHIYFYIVSPTDAYLNGELNSKNCEYLDWENGGKYPTLSKIYTKLKQTSNNINITEIDVLYKELSKFVHGRDNLNSYKLGMMANYFFEEENIKKYAEFQNRIYTIIRKILLKICNENLKPKNNIQSLLD